MLGSFGLGAARGRAQKINIKSFNFTSALPSEFTYTRSNVQTVRNSSGVWVSVAANTPPFDHTAAGTPLGLRFEPARTNKCTQRNFAPTDTTGVTVISGTATLACVANAHVANATIQGSGFAALQNGNAIEIQGGTSGGAVQISEQAGNTNVHSWRVCVAASTTGYAASIGFSDGVNLQGFTATVANTFYEITQENQAPNASARTIRVNVQPNKTVYLIGFQLEEGSFLTSPIVTNAATATRSMPVCVATGLENNAVPWFKNERGAIVAECMFAQIGFDNQYVFFANEGTGLTNTQAIYSSDDAGQCNARDTISSTNYQTDQIHCPVVNKRMPVAITWCDTESTAVVGPMRFKRCSRAGNPMNMDRIYIGGRPFNNVMFGWVKSLTVMDRYRNLSQLAVYMFPSVRTYRAFASGGQSNKHGYFRTELDGHNMGEANSIAQMDLYWTDSENWLVHGAENGSYLYKANDPNAANSNANWWYDPAGFDDSRWGPRMKYWEEVVQAFGVDRIQAIDWDQGESDANSTVSDFKAGTLAVFNRMREIIGNKPAFITGIGRRSDVPNAGYNNVRQAQRELVAENAWIYLAPEKFTQALSDYAHLTDAGYGAHAVQHMRRALSVLGLSVSGSTVSPVMAGAMRSGTTVTVTLTHGAGTDFTPSSGIRGFKFFDNTNEITINTAVRTNATTITLILAGAPSSGIERLYYGYGSMLEVEGNQASLVKDNSTYTLSLRSNVITL